MEVVWSVVTEPEHVSDTELGELRDYVSGRVRASARRRTAAASRTTSCGRRSLIRRAAAQWDDRLAAIKRISESAHREHEGG